MNDHCKEIEEYVERRVAEKCESEAGGKYAHEAGVCRGLLLSLATMNPEKPIGECLEELMECRRIKE